MWKDTNELNEVPIHEAATLRIAESVGTLHQPSKGRWKAGRYITDSAGRICNDVLTTQQFDDEELLGIRQSSDRALMQAALRHLKKEQLTFLLSYEMTPDTKEAPKSGKERQRACWLRQKVKRIFEELKETRLGRIQC